jgi:hypothetical protein
VRISDVQEVVAQAIKSRRWITDQQFWKELGHRLRGERSPTATVIEGRASQLQILCGFGDRSISFTAAPPHVTGRIGIVQPGLGQQAFFDLLAAGASVPAKQVRDLLAVFHDSVAQVAEQLVVCSA